MLLAIDIGNTSTALAVFNNCDIIEIFKYPSNKDFSSSEYEALFRKNLEKYKITGCIIASVVEELSNVVQEAVHNILDIKPLMLDCRLNLGINLRVKNPEKVGADRIANACGAFIQYSKPAIVVDLGSATTLDIINEDGDFVGGAIMPGLNLQLSSLNNNTSKLPKIEIDSIENAIGDNTKDAILSGVILGSASAVEGLVERAEKELGQKATIIATGGDSSLISKYMKRPFDYVNPSLTLEGLRYIFELNSRGC